MTDVGVEYASREEVILAVTDGGRFISCRVAMIVHPLRRYNSSRMGGGELSRKTESLL
jgi:hypothetical protein